MNYLTFLATIVFTITLAEGIYIFLKNPQSAVNRLFFFMTLCLCIWLFGAAIGYSARNKDEVILFFRICSFGFIFLHAFTLHFTLKVTKRIRQGFSSIFLYFIYLPSFYFLYRSWTGLIVYKDFIKTENVWTAIPDLGSSSLLLLMVNYLSYYGISVALLLSWRQKTNSKREKKQALVLILSMTASILLFNVEPFLLPLFTEYQSIAISPIFGILWISGVGFAVLRYRFLSWKPESISKEILNSIDEPVILLDTGYTPIFLNRAAEILFVRSRDIKIGSIEALPPDPPPELKEIITLSPSLSSDLERLVRGDIHNLSCRLLSSGNTSTYLDVKFSLLKDAYGDILGISLLGKEVKDEIKFRAVFPLSDREIEVLELLIGGKKGQEIAAILGISLRTVKYHNSSIYMKLQVHNKIELFRVLESYNMFPDQKSELVTFPLLLKNKKK